MASKVNVKFVVILAAVLVVLAGAVGFVGWTVVTKTGEELEALGDQAAAEGDWDNARLHYSKAVRHDPNNVVRLEKWLESVEHWQPPTETAYLNGYQGRYMLVRAALSDAQPDNIEAQLDFLDLIQRQQTLTGYTRGGVEQIIDKVNDLVEPWEDGASAPDGWQRLLRHRGYARADIYLNGGVIEDEEVQLAIDDLEAAIAADPNDGESLAYLVRIWSRMAALLVSQDRHDQAVRTLENSQNVIAAFLEDAPDNPWGEVYQSVTEFELARLRETRGLLPHEAAMVIRTMLPTFRPQFERSAQALEASEPPVDQRLIATLANLERAIRPESRMARTIAIAERSLEASPENDLLILYVAELNKQGGNMDRSMELLSVASGMPDLPMSLEGFMRFWTRRQATIERVEVMLTEVVENPTMDAGERESLLAESQTLRDAYAQQVSSDEPQLDYVDGLRAIADDELPEALSLLTSFNSQVQHSQGGGLWWQGQVAMQLGQEGSAETAFTRLVELQPNNLAAVAALAEAKLRLQKIDDAVMLYKRVLESNPDNERILERLAVAEALLDPDTADDPVLAVMVRARKARYGDDDTPGDPAAADRVLAEGLEANDGSIRIATELILLRLDEENLEGARAAAAIALAANPENDTMQRIAESLEQDDATGVLIELIDRSDRDEIDKIMSKHNLYATRGFPDKAAEMLEAAIEIDPDDPRAFEADFMNRIARGDLDGLDALADRAASLNIDRMNGLTFRARMHAARGQLANAIEALQQAVAQGAAPSSAYRMLAAQQRALGRYPDAISTLEQALTLKPDDTRTIRDYLGTLEAAGRRMDALGAARRMERYGRTDPAFVDAWLNLEAASGGKAGRDLAISRREQTLERVPTDRLNKVRLASLYMDERRWDDARSLIDDLSEQQRDIQTVEMLARWYADQGRVEVDGQTRNGVELARSAFTDYIVSIPNDEQTIGPWLRMAGFLADRGDVDVAARALSEARPLQDPEVLEADKMLGDLMITRGRYAEAAVSYQRIVDAGVDDASQTYLQRLIEANLRLGNFEEASRQLDSLDEPAASSLATILQRSEAARGLGDADRADDLLDRAIAEYPSDPLPLTIRASSRISRDGSFDDALADLDRALQLDPQFTRARRTRAGVYFRMSRTEDALRDLRTVIRQDPSQNDVIYTLLNELNRMGRDREAITVANEIIEQRPQDIVLIVNMAAAFSRFDEHARAVELYEIAWARSKAPSVAARLIGTLLRTEPPMLRRAPQVLAELKAVVPDADENSTITAIDAVIKEAQGNHDGAKAALSDSFRQCERNPSLMLTWGANVDEVFDDRTPGEAVAYMRALRREITGQGEGRWLDFLIAQRAAGIDETRNDGLRQLASLRETTPGDPVGMMSFQTDGAIRYGADDFEGAKLVWEAGLEQFPNNWEIANNLAYMIAKDLGKPTDALPIAERAVQNGQDQASTHDTLGFIYLELDRLDEARVSFDTAARLATNTRVRAEITLNQARLAVKQGRHNIARDLLTTVRESARSLGDDQARFEEAIDEILGQIGSEED